MADLVRTETERVVALTSSPDSALLLRWYEQLIDELPVAIFAKDLEGRYVVVNRRFVDSFSATTPLSRAEIIGRTDFDFLPATDAEVYDHKDKLVIRGHEIRDLEEQLVRPDGTTEFYRTTKTALHDAHGNPVGLFGFATEVSEPVRVAEALAASERRYRLALRASRDGIWELDLASQTVVLSARGSRLLHLPVTNEPRPNDSLFHYEDPIEKEDLATAILDLRDNPSRVLSFQYRVRLLDGERRTLRLEAAPVVENGEVTRVIGSVADVTEAVANEQRLVELANRDDLTSLDNRRALLEAIDRMLDDGVEGAALLYLDLDDFKLVNDSLGHLVGDQMLIEVARRLRSTVSPTDIVARFGGDEFAVLLRPEARDGGGDRVAEVSRAIIESFSTPFVLGDDVETYGSASIGALVLDGYGSSDELIRDADTAMYSAKKARASMRYFQPDMHHAAANLRKLHSDLRRAVEAQEFNLLYQPVVTAESHDVVSLEALLRWTPDGSTEPQSPAAFLPALEETGLIIDVGEWVIQESCRQLAEWRDVYGLADMNVSINLSRAQLHHGGLLDSIRSGLHLFGLPGSTVTFEITETAIAADHQDLHAILDEIRGLGATIAIDDFGVGQSCLSQLYDLPIDRIKIDMSFVQRITESRDHRDPVLGAILSMGGDLGMGTVAEGVESEAQARWLADHGCDFLQGYYFDRPLTPLAVTEQTRDATFRTSGGRVVVRPGLPLPPPVLKP